MKLLNSQIYVVCTPEGYPLKAYTNEQEAKKHLLNEIIERGNKFKFEVIALEVDDVFYKRLHLVALNTDDKKGGK